MIQRLRGAHPPEALARMYAEPHDHRRWGRGHGERVDEMIRLGSKRSWGLVADLSCGNGAVATKVTTGRVILGDIAPRYPIHGPIEQTLKALPPVDLFVLGETLEHLDRPGEVLGLIAQKSGSLLLSTPINAWGDSNNEHYWAWDKPGVEGLAGSAGWEVAEYSEVDSTAYGEPYHYGIWLFDRRKGGEHGLHEVGERQPAGKLADQDEGVQAAAVL